MPLVDLASLREEVEVEREWRESEIRFLRNIASSMDEAEANRMRRAIVVMLYAHFEGSCKAILSIYAEHLNKVGANVADVVSAIGACSMEEVFSGLRSPYKKSELFRAALPNDTQLHQFAREREFVESYDRVLSLPIRVPVDSIVDAEDNLKPSILKKILFRLGLDPGLVEPWQGDINVLLNYRNKIAHGELKDGVTVAQYEKVETAVIRVIDEVVGAISSSVSSVSYLSAVGQGRLVPG